MKNFQNSFCFEIKKRIILSVHGLLIFFEIRFFHFGSKSKLQNCNFHFTKSVLNQNIKNWQVPKINTDNFE